MRRLLIKARTRKNDPDVRRDDMPERAFFTEWNLNDARQALAWRKWQGENPVPLSYVTGALEHYRTDWDSMRAEHKRDDCDVWCADSPGGCIYDTHPVEPEHAALVGVFLPDDICPDDVWAVEIQYNRLGARFVMGITADGKYHLYQD